MSRYKLKDQSGLAAILAIVLISAVSVLAINFVSRQALSDLEISFIDSREKQVYYFINGCLDEALMQLNFNWNYSAVNQIITYPEGSCILSVSPDGDARNISISAQLDSYYKNIDAVAGKNNNIYLDSIENN